MQEHPSLWFAATMNYSDILIYQLIDDEASLVGTYSQPDGKRIIVHNYSGGTLIVMQEGIDGIVVLRFGRNRDEEFEIQFKQEFEIPEVTHMNMWLGMNRLYLGIASETKIYIYVWLGEHFDRIDTLPFGARKLLPFQNKSFMHVVIMGPLTKIFRFSVRSNKFVEMQELHYANDVSSFYFKEGHFEEHFLVLAGNESTILYKEMYDRFVPFQRIAPASHVHSLMMGNTVILLLVQQDIAEIYQYNGWRFVKLPMKLSNIHQIRPIHLYNENVLMIQNQDEWTFLRPIWTVKKTWKSLQDETIAWCSEIKQQMSQRPLEKLPDFKNPVISNAHIDQLRVQNLNNRSTEEFIHLMQRYKSTIDKLNLTKNFLAQEEDAKSKQILRGRKITVKCKTDCYVHRIVVNDGVLKSINKERFKKSKSSNQTIHFAQMKAKTIDNWKCPIPNFNIDDIFVKESVNGISIQDLKEKTLKVSGNQVVTGKHTFTDLHTKIAYLPLDIATIHTEEEVYMKEVRVKELFLINDEFFLPLNGTTTVMNGSISAAKVRFTGLVKTTGKIEGKGVERLKPLREIYEPLTLSGDRFLQDVTFRNIVKAKDIVRLRGRSMKEILKNSIPLDSDVPAHLILSSDKTQFNNVTLWDYVTTNWVTKNSPEPIIISGAKFTNNSVALSNATYENLPIPKLTVPLCAAEVVTPEIRTSSITMGDIIVKNLNVSHILGAHNLNATVFDSVSALQSVDFSTKRFIGKVFIKNISASVVKGINLKDFEIEMNKWIDVNRLKGPINVNKLVVDNLETPVYLNLSLPTRVKNVIVKGDSDIRNINNINIQSFMENVLKVDDLISLEHVTFAHGFISDHVYASRSTLKFPHLGAYLNLHSKQIATTLSTDEINVPQTFGYIANDMPSTFIIQGSATFLKEPIVQNINNVNLTELSKNVWMANQDTILLDSNLNFENITLKGDIYINNFNNSLNIKLWTDMMCKFLSKTKKQFITVVPSFKNVEVYNINAENTSTIQSSDLDLNELLTNSLMKDMPQTINASWHFEELYINNMYWDGKFNGIDLNKDIVRYDAKQNIVTGKKMVSNLITKDLWPLNIKFSNFTKYALIQKCQKLSIIKGQKTFNNISLNNLSVKGRIMDRDVENALLKSGNQTLFSIREIRGELNAPSFTIDGTVNDVNITALINEQMKKHKTLQTIESEMDFRNELIIFGNITIAGLYEKTDLSNITDQSDTDKVGQGLNRLTRVMASSEDIKIALQNRAIYVSKFEVVDENMLQIASNTSNAEEYESDTKNMNLNSTCLCEAENISSVCNDTKLLKFLAGTNSSIFLTKKLLLLDDIIFVVLASTDYVSVYSYIITEEKFHQIVGLYVPDILQVSAELIDDLLWIFLRLSEEILILRYQSWKNEFEQLVLPSSDAFVISKTPNNQHLLIRSDGMWNLAGVFRPEHIFKISLNGQIETFALGADYYVKATTENSTIVLKARYVGN
ncbi:hypothetical protein P5V15_002198 [Pogonomyrmex californicus]